jgi:hypothetical protein
MYNVHSTVMYSQWRYMSNGRMYIVHEYLSPVSVRDMRLYIWHLSQLAVHYSRMYIVHGYLSAVGVRDMRLYIWPNYISTGCTIDIHVQCIFYCNVQPVEIDVKCIISCHVHPLEIDIHVQCTFYCNVQPVEISSGCTWHEIIHLT